MNRSYFIDTLVAIKQRFPHRIALGYRMNKTFTFTDVYSFSSDLIKAIENIGLSSNDRVGVYFADRSLYLLTVPALYSKIISVSLKGTRSDESVIKSCIDRKVNVVLTDQVTPLLIQECKENKIGLIELINDQGVFLNTIVEFTSYESVIHEDPIIFINNSSGTTGNVKTFPRRLSEVLAIIEQESKVWRCDENTTRLITGYVDDASNINNILKGVFLGATMFTSDGIDPLLIHKMCHEYSINHMRISPAAMLTLFDDATSRKTDYLNCELKEVVVTGAAIMPSFLERYEAIFKAQFVHTYGSKETSNIASNFNAKKGYKEGSVGIVHLHDIKIIDGEICVKGPMVFKGYENIDNSEIFVDDYYRTGDYGSIDHYGYLTIHGRIRELINRGGEKISPIKIEKLIDNLNWFKESVVFSFINDRGIEDIICLVVLKNRSYSVKELRDALMKFIPAYHCPSYLIEDTSIEKTNENKVSRKALEQKYKDVIIQENASYEDALSIVKTCLNQKNLDPKDTFVSWGGDSIKYASLLSLVHFHLHKQVVLNDLMNCQNIQAMIELIDRTPSHEKKYELVWLRKNENVKPTLIFVHPKSGDVVTYRYVMQHLDQDISLAGLTFDPMMFDDYPPYQANDVIKWYTQAIIDQDIMDVVLCGLSIGGKIALQVAEKLKESSINVHQVIMLDTTFETHRYVRKWHPLRMIKLFYFDMETKRFGSFYSYLKTKISKLINNRLLRSKTQANAQLNLEKKLMNNVREFSSYEIERLVTNTFTEPLLKEYNVAVTYLHAKRERGEEHINVLRNHVKNLNVITMNCWHSDFVDIESKPTARIINDLMTKTKP